MPHRFWIYITALAISVSVLTTSAFATDDDEKGEESYVKIPKHLQKSGYRLRLPAGDIHLDGNRGALPENEPTDAELLDSQGRILDRGPISPQSTLALYPRNWLVGVSAGYVTPLPRSTWKKALLPFHTTETSFDVNYRFSEAWNGWAQLAFQSGDRNLDEDLQLRYESSRLLLGIAREWAPWGNHPTALLHRIHFELMGALGYDETLYELADSYTGVKAKNGTATAAMGAEVRMPLSGNLWLMVRDIGRITRLELEELDVHGTVFLNSTTAGVKYAF